MPFVSEYLGQFAAVVRMGLQLQQPDIGREGCSITMWNLLVALPARRADGLGDGYRAGIIRPVPRARQGVCAMPLPQWLGTYCRT
jgi:hypothetical protein